MSETLEVLAQRLASADSDEVIRSFMLIQQANPLAAKLYLPEMLKHPASQVRLHALKQIQDIPRRPALSILVEGLIATEQSPAVKSEALSTLSVLNEQKISATVTLLRTVSME